MKRRQGPVWAVVPAKCFDRGKSRLAPVLADSERAAFAAQLFDHTLSVLRASQAIDGILVATDCEAVARAAAVHGASVRLDGPRSKLSQVIDNALDDVTARGAAAALVVMADLPKLTAEDVWTVIDALDNHDVAMVADVHGRHTNVLAMAPPASIRTCFGAPESFADHCARVEAAGLRLARLVNARIAFDVDSPADHAAFVHPTRQPRTL